MLKDRLAALTARERAFLAAGAAAFLLFLLYLAPGDPEEQPVELTSAPPPLNASVSAPPAAPSAVAAAPAVAASTEGMILHGVLGGGSAAGAAIIASATGGQRLVRVGRLAAPGLTLKEVGLRHAILSSAGGDIRLEFNRLPSAVAPASSGAASAFAASSASNPRLPGAQSHRQATLQFRLGLQPRRAGGRITGFALRPGANLPLLERAGLRPGDVLVAVNGQAFESEEKVLELAQEIAGSYTAEFEFERGGRRLTKSLEVNQPR